MKKTVRDDVVEFENDGLDIARMASSRATKKATLVVSAKPSIHKKKELEINEPFLMTIPNYGLKQLKITAVDSDSVEVKVDDIDIWPNIMLFKDVDNSMMSKPVKDDIRNKLDHLVLKTNENSQLTEELKEDFAAHVEYIKESMERIGRKDWLILSMGLLGNFASGAFYAPDLVIEAVRSIATAIPQVFSGVSQIIPKVNQALSYPSYK
ncbi:hypothetical protein [Vibrio cyclitrophicus]|uniref:hypothetical protein n=1 Tax=Vibrio cyclitrophicus TaxID=47951 RepID=UPI0002E2D642|nr:hypothetical protein [Vibrio cyclitrophicus]OEF33883.1 hypothetical protein OA9_17165 [Vibrio cyclitrophicus 1F97]OEF46403.1 hypothetical protein OAC_06430 [Vibrio cyclitrophicus 1F273]OEF76738.1 hypothetical protein OA5_19760 [Vibrio cyclitrophicus 1F111]